MLSGGIVSRSLYGFQFNDGTELMLLALRRRDGEIRLTGSFVARDGTSRNIRSQPYRTPPGRFIWRSEQTGVRYTNSWNFAFPKFSLNIVVTPVQYDQEIFVPRVGAPYWDGAVEVRDFQGSYKPIGFGYVQLLGFDAGS